MILWQQWLQRPQSLGLRKAVFQIHLWTGIAIGLYVFAISVSGSAIVFRRELARTRRAVAVVAKSPRMSVDQLTRIAQRRYPAYEVFTVREPSALDQPDEMILGSGRSRMSRLFDPYTGADLGDPRSRVTSALEWLADLHFNLLSGLSGRIWNGAGAVLLTQLACTGALLWWPGIANWKRSTTVNWSARFARVNWDLHSAIGIWSVIFVLIWGVSGVCLCFPGVLERVVSNNILIWINRLHFGHFGWFAETIWTVLGLAPAALFVTGFLMWCRRTLLRRL